MDNEAEGDTGDNRETCAVGTLVQKNPDNSQIKRFRKSKIRPLAFLVQTEKNIKKQSEPKNVFKKFEECPILYQRCVGKDTTCLGDLDKFKACDTFFENYLTAPPAGYKLI
jgi:hypothetical protein